MNFPRLLILISLMAFCTAMVDQGHKDDKVERAFLNCRNQTLATLSACLKR